MISRFLVGIKSYCQLSSIFDHIKYVNNVHLSKLLNVSVKNNVNSTFCCNIIHYLTSNVDNLGSIELNSLVKNVLYSNYKLNSGVLNGILYKITNGCSFDESVALDTLYHLLLLDSSGSLSIDKCVRFIDNYRLSTNNSDQLELLNVFYNIQLFHPEIESSYTPNLNNFVKYLKLLSPKILLKSGICSESDAILDVKRTLDKLKLDYVSGVTGHIYNPIILKGTNMAIDINYDRSEDHESEYLKRIVSLKQFVMNEMGWKLKLIPIDEWKYNISEFDKKNYLSKFVCKYYLDTQFDKNPPWFAL